jgi:hypothetical protein
MCVCLWQGVGFTQGDQRGFILMAPMCGEGASELAETLSPEFPMRSSEEPPALLPSKRPPSALSVYNMFYNKQEFPARVGTCSSSLSLWAS